MTGAAIAALPIIAILALAALAYRRPAIGPRVAAAGVVLIILTLMVTIWRGELLAPIPIDSEGDTTCGLAVAC